MTTPVRKSSARDYFNLLKKPAKARSEQDNEMITHYLTNGTQKYDDKAHGQGAGAGAGVAVEHMLNGAYPRIRPKRTSPLKLPRDDAEPDCKFTSLPSIGGRDETPTPTASLGALGPAPERRVQTTPRDMRLSPREPSGRGSRTLPVIKTMGPDELWASPRRDSISGQSAVSTVYSTSHWKEDQKTKEWWKNVQKRKDLEVTRKVRQASKEAQWVLKRRQAQMKEIQRRQKAEQEAESKARKQGAAAKMRRMTTGGPLAGLSRFQKKSTLVNLLIKPVTKKHARTEEADDGVVILTPSGPEYGSTLPWKNIKEPEKHNLEQETAVWVKPGVFTTRKTLKLQK